MPLHKELFQKQGQSNAEYKIYISGIALIVTLEWSKYHLLYDKG